MQAGCNRPNTASVSLAPEMADCLSHLIQPIGISEQRNQFSGAKVFYGIGLWLPKRLKFSGADEDGNIIGRAVQELRPLSRQQARRKIPSSPGCHRRLNHLISHIQLLLIQAQEFYKEPLPAVGGGRYAPTAEPPAKVVRGDLGTS